MQTFVGMPLDRFKRALAAFVRELFPTLDYMGFYEYVVVGFSVTTQLADLRPLQNVGLPTLTKIPLRTPGVVLDLPTGMHVLVGFVNHDPTQPYVAFFDQLGDGGFVPTFTGLAGATPLDVPPAGAGVARVGDAAGPFLITTGSLKVKSR